MKLVRFKTDWADEFDVHGFKVFTPEKLEEYLEDARSVIEKAEGEFSFYFGTNQDLTFRDFKMFERCLTITDLNTRDYQTLLKVFGENIKYCGYGVWVEFDQE